MSADKIRRRSSLSSKRISFLMSEVTGGTLKHPDSNIHMSEGLSECISSALYSFNAEFIKSDGISPFGENQDLSQLTDKVMNSLSSSSPTANDKDLDKNDETTGSITSNDLGMIISCDSLLKSKEDEIASLNEERHNWEILLKRFEDEAEDNSILTLNRVIDFHGVSESVKNKAIQCQFLSSNFPYEETMSKCQQSANTTFLLMEDCVAKTQQLTNIQTELSKQLDSQYERFTQSFQDTSASDSDVAQLIENRIAIVSPANNK